MIQRLCIHNFKCLVNFELNLAGRESTLLVGREGSGKSSIRDGLRILQRIARGANRVSEVFCHGLASRLSQPEASATLTRFGLEVQLGDLQFSYQLVLDRPKGDRKYRVQLEILTCNGVELLSRSLAHAGFPVDRDFVALPLIQEKSARDPLFVFKRWLARMVILAPNPRIMSSDSDSKTLLLEPDASNFAAWFSGLIAESPAAWSDIKRFLGDALPNFADIRNPLVGQSTRSLEVQFQQNDLSIELPFHALSDGEKCYFLAAVALASKKACGPLFCFWDDVDSHFALSEVGQFLLSLRRAFQGSSQLVIASHHPEAVRHFSSDNTYLLQRRSHLEPTQVRQLSHVPFQGDILDAIIENRISL